MCKFIFVLRIQVSVVFKDETVDFVNIIFVYFQSDTPQGGNFNSRRASTPFGQGLTAIPRSAMGGTIKQNIRIGTK
jgi:hypothetical protein